MNGTGLEIKLVNRRLDAVNTEPNGRPRKIEQKFQQSEK